MSEEDEIGMNAEITDFPDRRFVNGRTPNVEAKEIAQLVIDAPIGKSIKIDISGRNDAKPIGIAVKYHVTKAGWKLITRTNGLGHLFLMRGSKIEG